MSIPASLSGRWYSSVLPDLEARLITNHVCGRSCRTAPKRRARSGWRCSWRRNGAGPMSWRRKAADSAGCSRRRSRLCERSCSQPTATMPAWRRSWILCEASYDDSFRMHCTECILVLLKQRLILSTLNFRQLVVDGETAR